MAGSSLDVCVVKRAMLASSVDRNFAAGSLDPGRRDACGPKVRERDWADEKKSLRYVEKEEAEGKTWYIRAIGLASEAVQFDAGGTCRLGRIGSVLRVPATKYLAMFLPMKQAPEFR